MNLLQQWHGHHCQPRDNVFYGKTMEVRQRETVEKENYLRKHGFQLQVIYYCQIKKECKENNKMGEFVKLLLKRLYHGPSLKPRDALRGNIL